MLNLDLSNAKESSFGVIPEGQYSVVCETAEIKDTKSGTGQYINCKFKILDTNQVGKYLFTMFNIANENQKAVEIGLGQLKNLLTVAGRDANKLQNVTDLEGIQATAVVKNKTDSYGEKAVISYFKPLKEGAAIFSDVSKNNEEVPF